MAKFLDLPDGILMKIMDYLPIKDKVYKFARLNRRCAYLVLDAYTRERDTCTDMEFEWYSDIEEFIDDLESNSNITWFVK